MSSPASVAEPVLLTPFSGSPDPTAVFLTAAIKSIIYKTRYAIDHRQGLAAILGDPGLGKSTILRYLYAQYSARPNCLCSFIPNPNFKSDFAVLKKICMDLDIEMKRSMLIQQSTFEDWLMEKYAEGRNVVVFIDEAQKLDSEQLELVRTLLNFETDKEKLIQVVLAGNLELRDRLKQKKHKPLLSRVFAPSLISPMTPEEVREMIRLRCQIESIPFPFEDPALKLIYDFSGGVPRYALKVCEFAFAQMKELEAGSVNEELVSTIVEDLNIDGN